MRHLFTITLLLVSKLFFAQLPFPDFLQGTWKVENSEKYEHWDILNPKSLKGISYSIVDGQIQISEYLEISQVKSKIYYTATVTNQNNGKGINFKLTSTETSFVFENARHDFPTRIEYQKISDTSIKVLVSGENQQGFSIKMNKVDTRKEKISSSNANPNFNSALAKKLGADNYGMKNYILIILKTGTNKTTDALVIDSCFSGHMGNIERLVSVGKLVVAGPLRKNERTYRGIFVLNVSDMEEAKVILQSDPAINIGLLDFELYHWYGSAALSEYLPIADKVWKVKP